jgi:branched-subunit amino acid aminotransferase/4-amino-4-deoxychorismate lyase
MSELSEPTALLDGVRAPLAETRLSVTDDGVARGDGGFETIGVWDGRPFALDDHLARLAGTMAAIGLPAPDGELLRREVADLCEGLTGDAALRIYLTASGTRLLTLDFQPVRPDAQVLVPQPAPWIRPLGEYGPAGAKTMSYLPNMAASRAARAAGGDDALLLSLEGWVLEGPTFAVYWVRDGVLHAPDVDLGIVDSISRRTVLGLAARDGIEVVQGRYRLDDLAAATEVLISSSVRDVISVRAVGDLRLPEGAAPLGAALSALLTRARRGG